MNSTIPGQITLFDYLGISPVSEKKPEKRNLAKGGNLASFAKKYNRKMMEDWGPSMSNEAKSFYRAFKNYLKREFPDAVLTGFRPNHYDFSGFLSKDGATIYVSHSLNRVCEGTYADFNDNGCHNGVLYRTAKSTKDFTGGVNNFCSIYELSDALRQMFDRCRRQEAA